MALNPAGMEKSLKELFETGQTDDISKAAESLSDIYYEYAREAENSFSYTFPFVSKANVELNKSALKTGLISAYLTQTPPTIASGIASAFTAFWLSPPVTFPDDSDSSSLPPPGGVAPNVWTSTIVTAVSGTASLQSSVLSEFSIVDPDLASAEVKAKKFAAYYSAFTKTVVVTVIVTPPSAPPITIPATLV